MSNIIVPKRNVQSVSKARTSPYSNIVASKPRSSSIRGSVIREAFIHLKVKLKTGKPGKPQRVLSLCDAAPFSTLAES